MQKVPKPDTKVISNQLFEEKTMLTVRTKKPTGQIVVMRPSTMLTGNMSNICYLQMVIQTLEFRILLGLLL